MKITWMQQNSPEPEAEKTLGEKTHNVSRAHSGGNAAFLAAPGAVYAEDGREWGGISRREKGKSLLEIQSQAEQADVADTDVTYHVRGRLCETAGGRL